jgi:hypothetical protein
VLEKPLDVPNPSCYDKSNNVIDNIDDFIHVGIHRWNEVGNGEDPIYDIYGQFQLLPSQLSHEIATNHDIWKKGYDIITYVFQTPKDDLMQCSHNYFQSYLEYFDKYSPAHLDIFNEEEFQPLLCSYSNEGKGMVCSEHEIYDKTFHPSFIPSSHYVTKDTTRRHASCLNFSPRKSLFLEFKRWLNALRRSFISQSFNFPLRSCHPSSSFLLVPS